MANEERIIRNKFVYRDRLDRFPNGQDPSTLMPYGTDAKKARTGVNTLPRIAGGSEDFVPVDRLPALPVSRSFKPGTINLRP